MAVIYSYLASEKRKGKHVFTKRQDMNYERARFEHEHDTWGIICLWLFWIKILETSLHKSRTDLGRPMRTTDDMEHGFEKRVVLGLREHISGRFI